MKKPAIFSKNSPLSFFAGLASIFFIVYSLWVSVDLGAYYGGGIKGIVIPIGVITLLSAFTSTLFDKKSKTLFSVLFAGLILFKTPHIFSHECAFSSEFAGLCGLFYLFWIGIISVIALFLFLYSYKFFSEKYSNSKIHSRLKMGVLVCTLLFGFVFGARTYLSIEIKKNDDNTNSIVVSNNSFYPYYVGLLSNDTEIRVDSHYIFCEEKNPFGSSPDQTLTLKKGFIIPFSSKIFTQSVNYGYNDLYLTAGWMEDTCFRTCNYTSDCDVSF